ncbi:hypothetical protein [Bradyrhizobium sp.]|uniref:hypothetical protein n=1 Tax=Bradyrhizobium sp. TaxID=376 RepID=UPI002732C6CC|nr:hypothetical protein [Bradyrhizobium sp.]MDP3076096.1 hypothetical protein [Bradyrhizobium sp.]
MPAPSSDQAAASAEAAPATHYAYKASLIGSAHQFELTAQGLSWHVGAKSGVWRYDELAEIRLSYRPASMQSRRFRCDITRNDGQRLAIYSTSWQTVALMTTQDRPYRDFITQLHARMRQAGGTASLIGGINSGLYAAGGVVVAAVAISIAGLLVRALATGEFAGALFLVGFAALFAWQIGGFMRRNRPQPYTFDALPQALLPQGK